MMILGLFLLQLLLAAVFISILFFTGELIIQALRKAVSFFDRISYE